MLTGWLEEIGPSQIDHRKMIDTSCGNNSTSITVDILIDKELFIHRVLLDIPLLELKKKKNLREQLLS